MVATGSAVMASRHFARFSIEGAPKQGLPEAAASNASICRSRAPAV